MSIVVAVTKNGQTCMASDSAVSFGSHLALDDSMDTEKIRKVGPNLVGLAGWGVYDCVFEDFLAGKKAPVLKDRLSVYRFFLKLWTVFKDGRYGFVNNQCSDKDSPFVELDSTFLIANRHGIFRVSSDLSVDLCKHYWAIGSGAEYAFGAMYQLFDRKLDAEKIATKAVETAIQFNQDCGGKIHILKVK